MAAAVRTSAAGGSSSGTGNRTATITPAVNDLFVVYCCVAANTNDTPTCSDDNGGSYDLIDVMNFAIAAVNYRMSVFVRTSLLANTTSTVVTVATGSNTSGIVHVLAITGVSRVGADAVRSKGSQNNQAAGTGAPVLNQSALTNNPTLAAIGSADTTTTAPTNWTEVQDTSFSNDTVALEEAFRATGFTGTTITFGAAQSTQFCTHAMELDTTALLTQSASDNIDNLADVSGLGYGNLHSDSVNNLADAAQVILGQRLSLSDNANNLADGEARLLSTAEMLSDTLTSLADSYAQLLVYLLQLTDSQTANWADSHQLLLAQFLALADSVNNLADITLLRLEQRVQFANALDALSDAAALVLSYELPLTDNANNLTDSYQQAVSQAETFSDSFTLSDAIEFQLAYLINLSDINADFPSTPVLDDFNRPDEGPPPSANWTLGFASGLEGEAELGHKVTSNQLANVGNDINQNWWNVAEYGPDCEAYITVTDSTNIVALGLAARLTNIDGFSSDGYYVQVNSSGGGTGRTYQIMRIDAGSATVLANTNETGVGSMTGNKYGVRVINDSVQLWGDTGSGWEIKLQARDSTYNSAGFLGILTEATTSSRWDDFGGGTSVLNLRDDFNYERSGNDISLQLPDAISLSDSLRIGYGLIFSDNADNLTDSTTPTLEYQLLFADTVTLNDTESHSLGQQLEFSDSFVLSESLSLQLDQQLSFAEALTLTDSEQHVLSYQISLSDDANTLNDSIALQPGQYLAFSDSLTLTDSATLRLEHLFALDDSFILTDSESHTLGYAKLFTDTLSLTDAESNQLGHLLIFTDLIDNLADAYSQVIGELLSFADTLTFSDSLRLGYGLVINDDINLLNDSIDTSAPQGPLRQVGVTDALATLSDEVALRLDYLLATADTITLSDVIQLAEGLRTTFSDLFTLTDSAASTLGYLQPLADSFALSDSIQLRVGYEIAISDSFTLADSIALRLGYQLAASDSFSLSDSVALIEGQLTSLSDSLALTDSEAATLGHLVPLVDSFALADSVQLRVGHELALSDTVVLSDSIALVFSYHLPLTDNVSLLADSLTFSYGLTLIITDNGPVFTEAIDFFSVGRLQLTDALALTDSLAKSGEGFLSLEDTLAITDSAVIELRGPDFNELLSDSLQFTDAITLTLGNELQLQLAITDTLTLSDHYFDLRFPYTPSTKRHIVVPSRARGTVVPRRGKVIVPVNDRTTKVG